MKWEYKVENSNDIARRDCGFIKYLDSCGAEGWELVAVVNRNDTSYYYFKRPLNKTCLS